MYAKTTVLITGANDGIGKQLACLYASPQHHLILIARNAQKLQQTAQLCEAKGASVIYQSIDVQDDDALKQFILATDAKTPVDLVIANAGVSATLQPHWQPERAVDAANIFAINLRGVLNTINPLLAVMMKRRHGQIALVSSLAGFRGLPQSPSYSASKAAVRVYGQALRAWLARYHVRVNVICPGYVATSMITTLHVPKPFLMSSEKAAWHIQKGLQKNKAIIVFPWQLGLLVRMTQWFPESWVDKVLNHFEPG